MTVFVIFGFLLSSVLIGWALSFLILQSLIWSLTRTNSDAARAMETNE